MPGAHHVYFAGDSADQMHTSWGMKYTLQTDFQRPFQLNPLPKPRWEAYADPSHDRPES